MKNMMKLYMFMLLCVLPLGAHAQSSHWTCDERAFQYDMSLFVALQSEEGQALSYDDYEIAAFVGDECRGVAKVQTLDGDAAYGYLRVRSNSSQGEEITFKVYRKSNKHELAAVPAAAVRFESNATQGMPSAPLMLTVDLANDVISGDVDGDGEVTINDVIMTINASLGKPSSNFNLSFADLDGDGEITINDVIMMIKLTLQN